MPGLSGRKTAGSQYSCGFPFCVLADFYRNRSRKFSFGIFHLHRIWGIVDRKACASFRLHVMESKGLFYFDLLLLRDGRFAWVLFDMEETKEVIG